MTLPVLRPFTIKDLDDIVAIDADAVPLARYSYYDMQKLLSESTAVGVVACDDCDTVCGFCLVCTMGKVILVTRIAVRTCWQRAEFGTVMLRSILARGVDLGFEAATTFVPDVLLPGAHNFFKAAGFAVVDYDRTNGVSAFRFDLKDGAAMLQRPRKGG
jgi:ribosomal protein S18 acetylase RimI-like enzyme